MNNNILVFTVVINYELLPAIPIVLLYPFQGGKQN